ncbi:sirohydrochlorin chelatase [Candidatus Mycobacterium wuenschmannii]|uniref:Sirohydrochlorin chelatase n=1 Tax=Candidatus Mycobacterium wuenschmannii TaxID=3027808 RepID=A0ABY8W337_9MYCO|nr:sirohydrochlorin chelatase [Candidatus Mycobacterium wuenschmannii]WIM89414.1 sirohydrochlorin chelatase [Candidatus Mycobacterium wuenschmannii]
MWTARVVRLVLAAHGSADPRSAANARAVANQIRFMRPGLQVRVAFCDLNTPRLPDVLTPDAVVTPFLLADAYHARIDIPGQIAASGLPVRQADVLGEDDRLIAVLHERLAGLGVTTDDPELGVAVVAIGSTHAAANARTTQVADILHAGAQWACTTTAFATVNGPSPADAVVELRRRGARRVVIAPWFLAPGKLTDRVAKYAATEGIPMAPPLGAHRLVAETVLDRFEAAIAQSVAA